MDAGEFEILEAPPAARAFVRRCLYANRRLDRPLIMEPKPTGYAYFSNAFGWSDHDTWIIDRRETTRRSRWYLAGHIVDQQIQVTFPEVSQSIFCELTATAPWRLFQLPGPQLIGAAIPVTEMEARFA